MNKVILFPSDKTTFTAFLADKVNQYFTFHMLDSHVMVMLKGGVSDQPVTN